MNGPAQQPKYTPEEIRDLSSKLRDWWDTVGSKELPSPITRDKNPMKSPILLVIASYLMGVLIGLSSKTHLPEAAGLIALVLVLPLGMYASRFYWRD